MRRLFILLIAFLNCACAEAASIRFVRTKDPHILSAHDIGEKQRQTAVIIGDSINQGFATHLRPYAETVPIRVFDYEKINFHTIFRYPKQITRKIDLIYINFAWLHMLHLYPIRAVWGANNYINNNKMILLYHLESMLDQELPKYASVANRVVVQIPSLICDSSYNGQYREWMNNQTFYRPLCIERVQEQANAVMNSSKWTNHSTATMEYNLDLRKPKDASKFCEYSLTRHGSSNLAERVRNYCKSRQLQCIDYAHMVENISCDLCPDGRHFDAENVVKKYVLPALLELVGWNQSVSL